MTPSDIPGPKWGLGANSAQLSSTNCLIILCYVTLSKLHFSSVLLFYYVRLSHILLNTVLLLLCYCVLLRPSYAALKSPLAQL